MKKITYILVLLMAGLSLNLFAQEEGEKQKDQPIRPPFESGYLLDNQTTYVPIKGTLEMIIHHRFGTIENGSSDLWGVYAPANIRLGMNYSITDNIQLGLGTTKFKKMQDLQYKWSILKQTRRNTIPVSVTLFGNVAVDAREEAVFGLDYTFAHRISYFNQLIISRKINEMFSIQIAPSFTHYNMTDTLIEHDKVAISLSGRAKISPQTSIVFNWDQPLHIQGLQEYKELTNKPLPNIGLGIEISTSTHAFHIFIASSQKIMPQETIMFNQYDFFDRGILVGFNMTRLWNF